jgi:hypothetical protein
MDERVRLFVWIGGSGTFFGLLGAGFGALTGLLHWRGGRAAGTAVGLRVARAFERIGGQGFSPATKGAIVGAVDGFLFLAVLGGLFGAIAGHGRFQAAATTSIAMGVLLLFAGALFFGGLAYAASAGGSRGVAALFFGAFAGGVPGFWLAAATGLLIGVIGGGTLGLVGLLLTRSLTRPGSPSPPLLPQTSDSRFKTLSDEIQESKPEDTW